MGKHDCDCDVIHAEVLEAVREKMPPAEHLERASVFFKVIGDGTRLRILCGISKEELCVCDIANLLGMTKSAISHQLGVLRKADLVQFRKAGKSVYYSLADEHVLGMLEAGLAHVHD